MSGLRRVVAHPAIWILFLWALAVAGRLVKSGESFGLDYGLYQPDGGRYIGLAKALVTWDFSAIDRITFSRPLYSILSVPFYAVLGDPGMLVVPALSLLLVGMCLLRIGQLNSLPWLGVAVFGALSVSVTVNRWMIADITDSPHLALFAVGCVLLYQGSSSLAFAPVLAFGLLTRPAGPVWIALILPFVLAGRGHARRGWSVLVGFAAVVTVLTLALVPDVSGFDPTGKVSWGERLARLPQRAITIPVVEFGELAVLDRLLLAFIMVALAAAWMRRRTFWAQVFALVMLACFALGIWNGVYGVNFRYQLPALIPAGIVLVEWAAQHFRSWSATREGIPQ